MRQPQSVYQNNIQAAAGAEASGAHSLTLHCIMSDLQPAKLTHPHVHPQGRTPKIDCSLTHANISLLHICMHTVCSCIVCVYIILTHWHSLYISLFTSPVMLSLVPDVFHCSTLLRGCLTLLPDIYIWVTLSNTLDWCRRAVSTKSVQLFTYLRYSIAAALLMHC